MLRCARKDVVRVWGVTGGSAGMEAQVKALAFALGIPVEMKTLRLHKSVAWLPNVLVAPIARFLRSQMTEKVDAAPDLVISCGRRGAAIALVLKNSSPWKGEAGWGALSTPTNAAADPHLTPPPSRGRKPLFIHIQDPQVSSAHFDLVIAMQHDHINGPNVLKTQFALHSVTPARLQEAAAHFAPRFAAYPAPHVAVLIGGSTNKYTLTTEAMAQLVMALRRLLDHMPGSLLITPSRRTGEANVAMLRAVFAENPRVYIYDGVEENPYMGLLALAQSIIVTDDSVNMMSEAAATGKPLHLLRLPGHSDTKPARFADSLLASGIAQLLGNRLETWDYEIPDEMGWLAAEVRKRVALS